MTSVLFVCLGNICRSPTAEGVFRVLAQRAGLAVSVDSAGTASWHTGNPPDPRSQTAAATAGYPIDDLRARQVTAEDFHRFDYVIAMDTANFEHLEGLRPPQSHAALHRFLEFSDSTRVDVPDPYYGEEDGFPRVVELIEQASHGLIGHLSSES